MALVSPVLVGGAVGGAVVGPHAPSPSAVALQKEIDESIGRGSVSVAAGDYYFGDASLVIHNAKNFTLRAESGPGTVQFWFAIGAGLLVNQSIDVVLDGLSIDYDPPAHYQGTIVQVNTSDDGDVVFARVKTDPGFLDPPAFNEAYKTGMPGVQSGPAALVWNASDPTVGAFSSALWPPATRGEEYIFSLRSASICTDIASVTTDSTNCLAGAKQHTPQPRDKVTAHVRVGCARRG